MIFQASHHYHQTAGHTPEATDLSTVTPHISNLTSQAPAALPWVDHHPSPASISSAHHPADFSTATASSLTHTHFNNNMMLTDIHHNAAATSGYHHPLGSPATSSSSEYPHHNGTIASNIPPLQAHMVSQCLIFLTTLDNIFVRFGLEIEFQMISNNIIDIPELSNHNQKYY